MSNGVRRAGGGPKKIAWEIILLIFTCRKIFHQRVNAEKCFSCSFMCALYFGWLFGKRTGVFFFLRLDHKFIDKWIPWKRTGVCLALHQGENINLGNEIFTEERN